MTTAHPDRLKLILRLALLASLVSLAAAYTAEFAFDLKPCHLCIAQRVPYAVVIVAALSGLWKPRHRIWLVCLIGAAFFIDSGIAAYHVSVEQHWVPGPTSCTSGGGTPGQSDEDFLKAVMAAPIVACDQPPWEFHGITMAGLNAAWCLGLGIATFTALMQSRRKAVAHA